jgi:hypothetical protein
VKRRRWRTLLTVAATVLAVTATGCARDGRAPDRAEVGARAAHTSTALPGGGVLVVGGCVVDGCATATNTVALVHGRTVKRVPSMVQARDAHTATLLPDGRLLIVGGFAGEGEAPTRSAELYDSERRAWLPGGELAVGRGGHAAAMLGGGRVVVAGGWIASQAYTDTIEVFDPRTSRFERGPSLPATVDGLAAVELPDGRALITGGQREPGLATDMAVLLSADGLTLTEVSPMLTPRFKHTMVVLGDGRVLVIGGTTDDVHLLTSTEIFDPELLAFAPGPTLRSGRYKLAGAVAEVDDDRFVVGGGGAGAELVDLRAETTSPFPEAPSGVSSYGTITAADGLLYFIGGYDRDIRLTGTFLVLPQTGL